MLTHLFSAAAGLGLCLSFTPSGPARQNGGGLGRLGSPSAYCSDAQKAAGMMAPAAFLSFSKRFFVPVSCACGELGQGQKFLFFLQKSLDYKPA